MDRDFRPLWVAVVVWQNCAPAKPSLAAALRIPACVWTLLLRCGIGADASRTIRKSRGVAADALTASYLYILISDHRWFFGRAHFKKSCVDMDLAFWPAVYGDDVYP